MELDCGYSSLELLWVSNESDVSQRGRGKQWVNTSGHLATFKVGFQTQTVMSYLPVSNTTAWLSTWLNSSIKLLLQIEQMFQPDPSVWNNSIGSEQEKWPPGVPLLLQQCRPVDKYRNCDNVSLLLCIVLLSCERMQPFNQVVLSFAVSAGVGVQEGSLWFWKQEGRIDMHTLTRSTHSQQFANSPVRSNILKPNKQNVGPFRFSYHRNLVPVWAQIQ